MKRHAQTVAEVESLYPYEPAEVYSLRRDGVELLRGTERECWAHIHGTFASSVHHALRFEGFEMVPVPPSELSVPPGLYAVQCLTHSRHVYDQEVGPGAIQYRVCGACGSLALFTKWVRLGSE